MHASVVSGLGVSASRRQFLAATSLALAGAVLPAAAQTAACLGPWREWRAFVERHVEASGRVIDFANGDLRSTSESQSYGLMFALIDNDPVLFDRILAWTRRHLCRGRADVHLPAWLWGRSPDGQWRVLDDNTASDGELWIAYALLEAGRLWKRPGLVEAGRQTLALIKREEVAALPGLGPMLLPGRQGFTQAGKWTLNPSYLPLFVLRRFAAVDPRGPWSQMASAAIKVIGGSAPVGFAADWISWNGRAFAVDAAHGVRGSYDAVRCYLWAGLTDAGDPLRAPLLRALSGPAGMLRSQGGFAEHIDTRQGVGTGAAPAGFSAALLPYLSAMNLPGQVKTQAARIPAPDKLPYYERALVLFGKGWLEHRYRISADGRLVPAWSTPCSATR